uniref:Uncharacterized protein n=1 Tax=mine drainage metagenome TaxID=410659 RepID=E6QTB9_9ZZZZ
MKNDAQQYPICSRRQQKKGGSSEKTQTPGHQSLSNMFRTGHEYSGAALLHLKTECLENL